MILTKTDTPDTVYLRNYLGYAVVCSKETVTASGGAQRGIRIVSREKPEGWIVNSTRFHGPKIVICKLIAGDQWTLIIREYLPPSTMDHLPDLEEALNRLPGRDTFLVGVKSYIGLVCN